MAQDLNHVAVIGHLTRDLENEKFGYTSGGMAVANISIAVNRSKKSGDQWTEEVSYFDVTIFGKAAENLKPYLVKGKAIAVDGYLKQDRWEKDGQKNSKVYIVANSIQLLGGKESSENNAVPGASSQSYNAGQNNRQFNGYTPPVTSAGDYQPEGSADFPEDIPF